MKHMQFMKDIVQVMVVSTKRDLDIVRMFLRYQTSTKFVFDKRLYQNIFLPIYTVNYIDWYALFRA